MQHHALMHIVHTKFKACTCYTRGMQGLPHQHWKAFTTNDISCTLSPHPLLLFRLLKGEQRTKKVRAHLRQWWRSQCHLKIVLWSHCIHNYMCQIIESNIRTAWKYTAKFRTMKNTISRETCNLYQMFFFRLSWSY